VPRSADRDVRRSRCVLWVMTRRAVVVGALLVLGLAPTASANVPGVSTTVLASRSVDGGFPNGRSQDPAISQDHKDASLLAYDSVATNIVPGDLNGVSDVFVVHRAEPYEHHADDASSWAPGATDLVSTGMGGAPADGPSTLPDLDGDQLHDSHCVAFVSAADNLVPGDTNGQPDAFVKDLRTGAMTRVSVATGGAQADGPTTDVQVDGACDRVAFTSSASNLALTKRRVRRRSDPRRPLVTGPAPAGTRQVYVRILGGQADDRRLRGTTFLASSTPHGAAGNGDSWDAQLGQLGAACPDACGTTSGDAVAFTTNAVLSAQDANGLPDVYERTFRRRNGRLSPTTLLVSSAGNGGADQPAINDSGRRVAYRTADTAFAANGVTNIVMADTDSGRTWLVSRTSIGPRIADGASSNPVISRNASVLFESAADNIAFVPGADKNCVADVLFWNPVNEHVAAESTTSDDLYPGSPNNPNLDPCPTARTAPAQNPATSYYNNFVAFEHNDPLVDLTVADSVYPGLRRDRTRASRLANGDATLHQVYMHLVGP
jgi:TolB protein